MVPISDHLIRYTLALVRQTRVREPGAPEFVREQLAWGAGPRAVQFLILGAKARALLQGRAHVAAEDIQALAKPVLRHRLVVNFAAESEGVTTDDLIDQLARPAPQPTKTNSSMTSVSKRSLHPELIKRIGRLEVRATAHRRGAAERDASQSVLRSVGRVPAAPAVRGRRRPAARRLEGLGQAGPAVRQAVRRGHQPAGCLLVDLSASMSYGSGAMTKCDYACTAAAALAYLLLAAAGRRGLRGVRRVDPPNRAAHRTSTSHLTTIVKALGDRRAARQDESVRRAGASGRDLSAPRHDGAAFRSAGRRRTTCCAGCAGCGSGDTTCWCCTCWTTTSWTFPLPDRRGSRDSKSTEHLSCNPRALREGYLDALEAFWPRCGAAVPATASTTRWSAPAMPLDAALIAFLSHRNRRAAVNGRQGVFNVSFLFPRSADDRPAAGGRAGVDPPDQPPPAAADPLGGDAVSCSKASGRTSGGSCSSSGCCWRRGWRRSLLLVLLLAHVVVRNEWLRLLGSGTTHHVVLVDDSYSMSDRWENTSALAEAKRAVAGDRRPGASAVGFAVGDTVAILRGGPALGRRPAGGVSPSRSTIVPQPAGNAAGRLAAVADRRRAGRRAEGGAAAAARPAKIRR